MENFVMDEIIAHDIEDVDQGYLNFDFYDELEFKQFYLSPSDIKLKAKEEDEGIFKRINEGLINNENKKDNKNIYYDQKTVETSKKIFTIKVIKGKMGRKKKISKEFRLHDKFYHDNLIRKSKRAILESLRKCINNSLKKICKYNNRNYNRQLLIINHQQIFKAKVDYNKAFINKKIKDIFSDDISSKYKRYSREHNRKLIHDLLNDEDEIIRKKYQKIFNLTFLDCLKTFRGDIFIDVLDGLIKIDEFCESLKNKDEDNEQYIEEFRVFIQNYENIIQSKYSRYSRNHIKRFD